MLIEYRDPDGRDILSVTVSNLRSLRYVEALIRSHPSVSDYSVIDEIGDPRVIWVRTADGWVPE